MSDRRISIAGYNCKRTRVTLRGRRCGQQREDAKESNEIHGWQREVYVDVIVGVGVSDVENWTKGRDSYITFSQSECECK